MTQNDKDARTETNMDGTTWREANSETFGSNPTAGGMRTGMINVDRPDNRYSDREWNNDRDGLGWGLGSCSQCVFRSVCETVTVAWGCSRQLTWHCCGLPREIQLSTAARGNCIRERRARKTKLQNALTSLARPILQEKGLLKKTQWSEAFQDGKTKGNLSQAALSTLLLPKQIITQCNVF